MADERGQLAAELKRAFASLPRSASVDVAARPLAPRVEAADASPIANPVGGESTSEGSISFTSMLLRAVLDGHKTQTRRPIRPVPASVNGGVPRLSDGSPVAPIACVGDRMWVREKYAKLKDGRFVYAMDQPSQRERWISPRFMPRAAARHFLRVESVAVARLSDIDDADALAEGAAADPSGLMYGPRAWFLRTWDAIYGDGEFAAASDPWVWVIGFRLTSSGGRAATP